METCCFCSHISLAKELTWPQMVPKRARKHDTNICLEIKENICEKHLIAIPNVLCFVKFQLSFFPGSSIWIIWFIILCLFYIVLLFYYGSSSFLSYSKCFLSIHIRNPLLFPVLMLHILLTGTADSFLWYFFPLI